jgi:NRAMP (natural resistance-associated macrophage protein)-like metal ion transporter
MGGRGSAERLCCQCCVAATAAMCCVHHVITCTSLGLLHIIIKSRHHVCPSTNQAMRHHVCVLIQLSMHQVRTLHPPRQVMRGYLPSLGLVKDQQQLYLATGILGATVMPHNLYLHSSIIQTRAYPR